MTILDRSQLTSAAQSLFPAAAVQAPFDVRYALVTHGHVEEVFGPEFSTQLLFLRGRTAWALAFDCDKFARHAASLISLKHSIAQGVNTDTPEGVAFGILCYKINGNPARGHCINIMITERGVETWEPQAQQFVTLTDDERKSAWLVQF